MIKELNKLTLESVVSLYYEAGTFGKELASETVAKLEEINKKTIGEILDDINDKSFEETVIDMIETFNPGLAGELSVRR